MCQARKIADAAPNLVELVEMAGTARRWNIPRRSTTTCAPWCRRCSRIGASALRVCPLPGTNSSLMNLWRTDGAPSCAQDSWYQARLTREGLRDRKIAMNEMQTTDGGRACSPPRSWPHWWAWGSARLRSPTPPTTAGWAITWPATPALRSPGWRGTWNVPPAGDSQPLGCWVDPLGEQHCHPDAVSRVGRPPPRRPPAASAPPHP